MKSRGMLQREVVEMIQVPIVQATVPPPNGVLGNWCVLGDALFGPVSVETFMEIRQIRFRVVPPADLSAFPHTWETAVAGLAVQLQLLRSLDEKVVGALCAALAIPVSGPTAVSLRTPALFSPEQRKWKVEGSAPLALAGATLGIFFEGRTWAAEEVDTQERFMRAARAQQKGPTT